MNFTLLTGFIGSIILIIGAAWPEGKVYNHPVRSVKNWLFAIGSIFMFLYAILGYFQGGPVFFVFLEILILIATVLMMLDTDDRIDAAVITIAGLTLIIWSLALFEGYKTIFFIIGLSSAGLGYTFKTATLRRGIALTIGSILIAIFSYFEASWIFFWLNVFFAVFSGFYLTKQIFFQRS